ncbi:MAG: LamG-like jellyroll fold domain-containing protein, partial [Gammaproteobacteria bacterium]
MGNISLTIAAVAMLAVGIGQVQAEPINVPNGDFQLYKPGTGYTVTATFAPGNNYAAGVGDNLTVKGDGIADYSDGTSGGFVDCPGWTGPIGETNTNDLWSSGIDDDGTTAFNAFGTWSGGNGSLVESADSLGDIAGGAIYTVSAMVEGPAGPLTLELLAGGVALPPSSSVTPASPTVGWEEISRTYDADAIAGYVGEPITIVIGIAKLGDELYGSRVRFDDVSLSYHVLGPPSQATNPNPSNGATDVWPDSNLNWTAGDGSESSDVYFGTDPTPDSNEFQDNQVETFFDLDTMAEDTTYYWRIDAVNTYGTTPGEVWSFTTIVDSSTCPPVLVLPPVTGCDGLVLTDPSSIDTQSAGIITNTGGGIGRTDSTTVNNGESIDILNSGCFQLGKDGSDFALSFWLKATGAAQIIGTKTQYNGNQGFIVYVDGDSRLRVASSEGSGNTSLRSEPFQLNEWVHVVINYVNDGVDATFEVNVNLAPTFGFAYGNVYNSNLRIGDEGWGSISSFDVCAFQSWGRALSRNEIKALYFDKASYLGLSSAILSSVMSDIMDHLTDTTPLTGTQIETLTETFVENGRFLDENTAVMTEAFDLVNYYETTEGPLFINAQTAGGFARVQQGSDGFELERAIFTIQQEIHDRFFDAENCQSCQSLFNGKVFETSDFFPGACDDPTNPETVYEVDINGSNPTMWGKPVCYGPIPARRPTGLYLAPGSIGEVTV